MTSLYTVTNEAYNSATQDYEGSSETRLVPVVEFDKLDGTGEFGMDTCYTAYVGDECVGVFYSDNADEFAAFDLAQ